MPEESLQNDQLLRYILGELDEGEQARLEESYFLDPARRQELWVVFDEVAERFLQQELTNAEEQQFAARLQTSLFLRERVTQLQGLLATMAARPATVVQTDTPWSRRFAEWRWQGGMLAATALLLIVGVLWWNRAPSTPVPIAKREEPTPQPTLSAVRSTTTPSATPVPQTTSTTKAKPSSLAPTLATFILARTTVRDASIATPLPIAPQVRTLQLQLEVPAPTFQRYQVTTTTAEGRTYAVTNLRPQRRRDLWFVTARLPRTELGEAQFTLQIAGLPPQQAPVLVQARTLQIEKK